MTYRVEFHSKADEETRGLRAEVFGALVEALVQASRDPWGSSREDRPPEGPDATYRWMSFGQGYGIVQFQIDDRERVLRVYGVTWTG